VYFSVLGPVRAWRGETEINLGIPQQRAILALLLVRAGRPAPLHEVADLLWPDSAPASAPGIVHSRMSRLRQILPAGTPGRRQTRMTAETGGQALTPCPPSARASGLAYDSAVRRRSAHALTPRCGAGRSGRGGGREAPWADEARSGWPA